MNDKVYQELARDIVDNGMLCSGRVANLTHYLLRVSPLNGDMVEFGCHYGRTAALMAHVVPERFIWLYDSFEGLPERTAADAGALELFKPGVLAVDEMMVRRLFEKHQLRLPVVHRDWFDKIPNEYLPVKICFAHLDGDLYTSIRDSLQHVYPRLVGGGICIIDDYGWNGLPGVKAAVDEYMSCKEECVRVLNTGNPDGCQAVIVRI